MQKHKKSKKIKLKKEFIALCIFSISICVAIIASVVASVTQVKVEDSNVVNLNANNTYKQTLSKPKPSADDWNLILVNKWHPLPDNYDINLIEVEKDKKADVRTIEAYNKLKDAAKKDGIELSVASAYRSAKYQAELYESTFKNNLKKGMTKEEAKEATEKYQAPPGTSEHSTGLAFDIVDSSWFKHHKELTDDFEQTPTCEWLKKNAPNHGFILRYMKDKEEITGYNYEPWHYRYVGAEIAKEITKQGITLEEYLDSLKE